MGNIAVFIPIAAIVATAWVVISILHYKSEARSHGNESEADEARRHVEGLAAENERLHGQVSRLEERIAVLERIATDPAERTSREIEKLR